MKEKKLYPLFTYQTTYHFFSLNKYVLKFQRKEYERRKNYSWLRLFAYVKRIAKSYLGTIVIVEYL